MQTKQKKEEKKEERNDVKKWEQINQLNELERSAAGLLQLSNDDRVPHIAISATFL